MAGSRYPELKAGLESEGYRVQEYDKPVGERTTGMYAGTLIIALRPGDKSAKVINMDDLNGTQIPPRWRRDLEVTDGLPTRHAWFNNGAIFREETYTSLGNHQFRCRVVEGSAAPVDSTMSEADVKKGFAAELSMVAGEIASLPAAVRRSFESAKLGTA